MWLWDLSVFYFIFKSFYVMFSARGFFKAHFLSLFASAFSPFILSVCFCNILQWSYGRFSQGGSRAIQVVVLFWFFATPVLKKTRNEAMCIPFAQWSCFIQALLPCAFSSLQPELLQLFLRSFPFILNNCPFNTCRSTHSCVKRRNGSISWHWKQGGQLCFSVKCAPLRSAVS